jgi:hypothetical protein
MQRMRFQAGINFFLDRHEKNVFPSWNHLFENMKRARFQAGINYFRTTCKECVYKLESIISERHANNALQSWNQYFPEIYRKGVAPNWNQLFQNDMQGMRFEAGIIYLRRTCKECVSKPESFFFRMT